MSFEKVLSKSKNVVKKAVESALLGSLLVLGNPPDANAQTTGARTEVRQNSSDKSFFEQQILKKYKGKNVLDMIVRESSQHRNNTFFDILTLAPKGLNLIQIEEVIFLLAEKDYRSYDLYRVIFQSESNLKKVLELGLLDKVSLKVLLSDLSTSKIVFESIKINKFSYKFLEQILKDELMPEVVKNKFSLEIFNKNNKFILDTLVANGLSKEQIVKIYLNDKGSINKDEYFLPSDLGVVSKVFLELLVTEHSDKMFWLCPDFFALYEKNQGNPDLIRQMVFKNHNLVNFIIQELYNNAQITNYFIKNNIVKNSLFELLVGQEKFIKSFVNNIIPSIQSKEGFDRHFKKILSMGYNYQFLSDELALLISKQIEEKNPIMSSQQSIKFKENLKSYFKESLTRYNNDIFGKKITLNYMMRTINSFHNDNQFRTELVSLFSGFDLANLITYGSTEIFTSTTSFTNFLLPKVLKEIQHENSLTGYLSKYLPEPSEQRDFLLVFFRYNFIEGLFKNTPVLISDMSYIFNLFTNNVKPTSDTLINNYVFFKSFFNGPLSLDLKYLLENLFIKKYEMLQMANDNKNAKYFAASILGVDINNFSQSNRQYFKEIIQSMGIEIKQVLPKDDVMSKVLVGQEEISLHRSVQFFVNGSDNDGIASFNHTISELEKHNWIRSEINQYYSVFTKKAGNKTAEMILFQPIPEYDVDLPVSIINKFKSMDIHAVSYRGHSTYVTKVTHILSKIFKERDQTESRFKSPRIFNAGSCGGIASMTAFLSAMGGDISHVTGTEREGTMHVNSLLTVLQAEQILKQESFDSVLFKSVAKNSLGGEKRFPHYLFPHENFIPVIYKFLTNQFEQ